MSGWSYQNQKVVCDFVDLDAVQQTTLNSAPGSPAWLDNSRVVRNQMSRRDVTADDSGLLLEMEPLGEQPRISSIEVSTGSKSLLAYKITWTKPSALQSVESEHILSDEKVKNVGRYDVADGDFITGFGLVTSNIGKYDQQTVSAFVIQTANGDEKRIGVKKNDAEVHMLHESTPDAVSEVLTFSIERYIIEGMSKPVAIAVSGWCDVIDHE